MSALDLDALEALCDAATPGPWVAAPSPWEGVSAPHGDPRDGGSCEIVDCVRGPSHGDAAFIAAAREALPALITRLRAAESEVDAAREALGGSFWTTEGLADGIRRKTAATERDADARLRAAEARAAWQPIETVAIDETVLLWDPVRRGVRMGHVSIRRGCVYTHWMPLPAAPEAPHV